MLCNTHERTCARTVIALALSAGFAAPAGHALAQSAPLRVVVLSGDAAPGGAPGVGFSSVDLGFGFAYLNNAGQVAFMANQTGPGVMAANDRGIWAGSPGALALAAREGDAAPDLAGATYALLTETPSLSGDGAVAFRAVIAGPGIGPANDEAMFAGLPGAVRLAAREGDAAPGPPGSIYGSFAQSRVNSFHELAYIGTFGSGLQALWFGAPGGITHILSVGYPAPGLPPGISYGLLAANAPSVVLNSAGQIVYRGMVAGPGIVAANDDAIWGGTPGSTHLIARAGAAAPGSVTYPDGGIFSAFEDPVITDSGAAAFRAFLAGPSVTTANDFGIYREIILGVLAKVAREGELAPGTGGAVFDRLDALATAGAPRMNNAHGVSFRAVVSGAGTTPANDVGIFGHSDIGIVVLIARESDPVVAVGAGVTLGSINAVPPVLNGQNRVAFMATLTGGGVTLADDAAILATNGLGDLVVAAREGGAVEVSPGVLRTLTTIRVISGTGTQDGAPTSYNDRGVLIFRADLNDGRAAILLSDVNATCRPTVSSHPTDATSCVGGAASFGVSGAGAGLSYQWRHDGLPLTDGAGVSGASTPHLMLSGLGTMDVGTYDCIVGNVCGGTASNGAVLTVCYANCDCSTILPTLNVGDFTCFLQRFAAGEPYANCDGSTVPPVLNVGDFTCFLENVAAGCP
jgi:hypothetical protein